MSLPTDDAAIARLVSTFDWSATPLGPKQSWAPGLADAIARSLPAFFRQSGVVDLIQDRTISRLEQQARTFDQIAATTPDFLYIFDLNGRFLYANRRLLEVWGITLEEAIGKSLPELGYPDWHVEMHLRELAQVIETKQPIKGEVPFTGGSGISGVYEYIFTPVLGPDGNVEVVAGTTRDITERRHLAAERERLLQALNAERTNLASIVESAPAFICTFRGPDHIFELANAGYQELVGHRDLIGKSVRAALPDVAGQGFYELLDTVYRTGKPHIGNEVPVVIKRDSETETRFVNFVYQALRGHDGNVTGIFVHGVDVTDIVRSGKAIQESEARFRHLANSMPQVVWSASSDGTVDYYNRRWFEYVRLPDSSAADAGWERFVHPDDYGRVAAEWKRCLANGCFYNIEFRLRNGGGEYRWFIVRAEPVRDAAGAVLRWYGTFTDIEDRKHDERRDRLLVALDDAVRPLVDSKDITATYARLLAEHLDADRCAYADVEADQDTFNLTGDYTRGVPSIVGRYRFADFGQEVLQLMRDDQPFVVQDVDNHAPPISDLTAYRATKIQAVICVPLHKQGRFAAAMAVHQRVPRRWLPAEVELVRHVAARCWESIERARVLRDREHLLLSEQAARAEAERASRMKDEFLATLSHELRTPLNAILGWSQIVQQEDGLPETATQGMEVIERNARAQAQIIDDLLDMSRIISGKVRLDVQRLDLSAIVQAAVDTARPTADAKGVRLQSIIDPLNGVAVSGDGNRLQQVLWNLLSNAIKFTPRSGRVQVLLERINSHLEISVIDTGEGIDPKFLPFVFDRFRQADASTTRRHGGLGLGLSIVKQLVELHGGTITVKSAGSGFGTTFTITLPLLVMHHEIPQEAERQHPRVRSPMTGVPNSCQDIAGVRVLVVDDEPDARALVKRLLEDCEAIVTAAGSADEAVSLVQSQPFDVLVSDIGMPGEDGYSLIRRVRALGSDRGGNLPAIALTAYARAEDRVKAVASGFQMHVAKPVEPVELITMVAGASGRTGVHLKSE